MKIRYRIASLDKEGFYRIELLNITTQLWRARKWVKLILEKDPKRKLAIREYSNPDDPAHWEIIEYHESKRSEVQNELRN